MRKRTSLLTVGLMLFLSGAVAAAVQPFLAPAQSSGVVLVKLYPTEVVSPGTSVLVTFGVPFTRGSLTLAQASTIRVFKNSDQEIPAYVDVMAPWRHLTNQSIDGASIRFARVQIHYIFSVGHPNYETVTVQWGVTQRTQNVTTLVNPRSAWHLADSGDWSSSDGVNEPDVYALFPKDVLSEGVFKGRRMNPMPPSVQEEPEDPAITDVTTYPGYEEMAHGYKNFFHTVINDPHPFVGGQGGEGGGPNPYKTDYEPWLYDRAASMFVLYFRSGYITPLREAVRNAEFYQMHLDSNGQFVLKPSFDLKYVYGECSAYAYWATGDDTFVDAVLRAADSHEDPSHSPMGAWNLNLNMWTERHTGLRMMANVIAYEVTGDSQWKSNTIRDIQNFIWHQNGASGQIPGNVVDGALYHYGVQHSWDWEVDTLGASPWMSDMVADAMLRAYTVSESADVGHFIRRMGSWEKEALMYGDTWDTEDLPNPWYFPAYAYCYCLSFEDCSGDNYFNYGEHSFEVTGMMAWGAYFGNLLGDPPDPSLIQRVDDLYWTVRTNIKIWTREAKPSFRVSPPRKWAWQYRNSASLSWCMGQARELGIITTMLPNGTRDVYYSQTLFKRLLH